MPLDLVHDEQAGSHWVRGIPGLPDTHQHGWFWFRRELRKFRRIFGGMIRAELPVASQRQSQPHRFRDSQPHKRVTEGLWPQIGTTRPPSTARDDRATTGGDAKNHNTRRPTAQAGDRRAEAAD